MAKSTPSTTLAGDRRAFLRATGSAFAALAASGCAARNAVANAGYGALVADPDGLLDLPMGFSYRVISRLGDQMDDGGTVPDKADGMGCFSLPGGKLALVRNHELVPGDEPGGPLADGYDRHHGAAFLPGGTTTMVLDAGTLALERQYRSLGGTIRNCAGGATPWGSWLSCEEFVAPAGGALGREHGYVFEVPASGEGLAEPRPLKAMGRFNHEAAAIDPASGIAYLTEDRDDGLFYRFVPDVRGRLAQGGRLEALALEAGDARNWNGADIAQRGWLPARWVALDEVTAPADDLRHRGAALGATRFARGEGVFMGEGELYFCATSGGAARRGQVFRLKPKPGGPDMLQLFYEASASAAYDYGDNLCVAPNGHLVVCEDQPGLVVDNHLRGISPAGEAYPLARLRLQTELAGACFSPDGRVLFVNVYSPAATLAIEGPWIA